jgi:penicillin-binding protein 1A
VAAAAKYYFGKALPELSIAEVALLASIPPSPNGIYNVFKRPHNVLRKRNIVLGRMLKLNFITLQEYQDNLKVELPKTSHDINDESIGDYFLEEIRRYIESSHGEKLLYKGGLKVYSTLNSQMQKWGEIALKKGIQDLDKRRGWRKNQKLYNLITEKKDLQSYQLPEWKKMKIEINEIVQAVVMSVDKNKALIRIPEYQGTLEAKDAAWTNRTLSTILSAGDVILIKILEIDQQTKKIKASLEQDPEVQGAIVVIENKTGYVKAMVGGYNFDDSKYNRVTQAKRQPGSTFKPLIYSTALQHGYTPATIINDEPVSYYNKEINEHYEPKNDGGNYVGPITLRRALEQSRNVISAQLVQAITPEQIINYARRFGISTKLQPTMSIALGAYEVKLIEMAAAYTVFPNYGNKIEPIYIKSIVDMNNRTLEENFPQKRQVIDKETAYVINYLMQGVIQSGTGVRARHLLKLTPLGGKTGTTDDYTNAWFIGFSPTVTVGVWIGFDQPKKLGYKEEGSRAACPVFVNFMENYLKEFPETQTFEKPQGVIMVKIDKFTGKLYSTECMYPFNEAFIAGTEPVQICREEDHQKIRDYYGPIDGEDIL